MFFVDKSEYNMRKRITFAAAMDEETLYRQAEDLLVRHRKTIWKQCWDYVRGDQDRCQDLVQEVSIVLLRHIGALRPGASESQVRRWIYWNTRTTLFNMQRKAAPRVDWMADAINDLYENPRDEARRQARERIQCLGEEDRQVMTLHLDGMTNTEIAALTGKTTEGIRKQILRIIKQLKKTYNP